MLRVEELDELLDQGLEDPQAVLDTLVNAAAKGQHLPALFEKLHSVAEAQDKAADLAFAYESLSQDRRVRLLSAEQQAHVFMNAVQFFADTFGDPDGAVTYAERVLASVPGHPEAVARLEKIFGDSGDSERLAKLYLDLASHERDPVAQLRRLRQALEVSSDEPSLDAITVDALQKAHKLDPGDSWVRETLEHRLVRAGRARDAVKLLESALGRDPAPSEVDAFQIRTRLLDLYTKDMGEPHRAVPHLEALLAQTPDHAQARQVAEALLENRAVAARVAAALSDAYFKLGMRDQAAAMLNLELKTVRGPRRLEVQRRLAFIRQDDGDPSGALELLGPVVSAEPGEDEARRRFVELSLSLNQPAEAARLLTRALGTCKDLEARARIGADIGTVYLRSGDLKQAEAHFKQVLEGAVDPKATLAAARSLAEMFEKSGDQKGLAGALDAVVRLEPDADKRNDAARRLARMAEGELNEPARAVTAWRALVDSPWADEALRKLSGLHEEHGEWEGLIDVTERRATRAKDPAEAQQLAFRAAELRTQKGRDRAAALGAWRAYLARFGASREAHAQMIPLLEQEKQWKELAWVLEREIEQAPKDEWLGLLNRLAQLRLSRLEDIAGALAAYRKALETDPTDKVSRAAVEKLLLTGDARLEAADILERVYRDEEPGVGLLRVVETRAELAEEPGARLAALEEAIAIAGGNLHDPLRALELAGRGLALVVTSDRALVPAWLEQVRAFGAEAGKPLVHAQALTSALGDRPVDGPEMLALARATAEALVANGQGPAAIEIYRKALEFEPSSAELLTRVDELLAEQGSPDERLALYQNALARDPAPARRRELLHSMARLQQQELASPEAAVGTWKQALADDARDAVAHQALVDLYAEQHDWSALYAELERALALHEGERRNATLLRMAEVKAEAGDVPRALEHYRELLSTAELDDHALENIELLANANGDATTMQTVLERRIAVAGAPEDRATLFEKLGIVQAKQLVDADAAAASWLTGARFADAAGDDERARRMYERVLGVAPDNADAARRLIELYAADGSWERIPEAFAVLLRAGTDERDVVALLLGLEAPAAEAGRTDVFSVLTAAMLEREGLEVARARQVLLARARVLSVNREHREEVSEIYRRVLSDGGDDAAAAADAFNVFLASGELTPARIADRRWLFEWRANRAADPTTVLIAWALAEETTLGNPAAAIEIYKRVLATDPDRADAMTQLARLQASHEDPEGALATLHALRERTEGEQRASVEMSMASLLLERLGRPAEALATLEPLLDAAPGDAEALRVVRAALAYPEARPQAALLLERVAGAAETPAQRAEVLESLLTVSHGVEELAEARGRWYRQLLETSEEDEQAALEIALRGAEERPDDGELWDSAEKLTRRLNQPELVAAAYARALEQQLAPDVAEDLGRRLVEFYEEWFEDAERVVGLLERVLELCPTADWAFDRLKLAFNASARWPDLFRLYDRALERASDEARRTDLLREAAMAAKDFANDADRAISYFEQLSQLVPDDARVDAALERLYERDERTRPLIALLTRRRESESGKSQAETTLRIASLWLDLEDAVEAYRLLDSFDGENESAVLELLERLIALPAARGSIAPDGEAKKKKKKAARTVRHAAAEKLRKRYEAADRLTDVARMLEVELELEDDKSERARRLEQIIQLKLDTIGDLEGAFESTAQLVALEPAESAHRKQLADLAEKNEAYARRADILRTVADGVDDLATRLGLLLEAAQVRRALARDSAGAIELYQRVLREAVDNREAALAAARELDELLDAAGLPQERCTVLEQLAELETDAERRRKALGDAARVSGKVLGDWLRAIRAWRLRLSDDAADAEALDGLCDALAVGGMWADLIGALEQRAQISEPEAAKRDRVGIAQLWDAQLGTPSKAIEAWVTVRAEHGPDPESYEALVALYTQTRDFAALCALCEQEAKEEADAERKRTILATLADTHLSHTKKLDAALESFVAAGKWIRLRDVVAATTDREEGRALAELAFEQAEAAWAEEPEGPPFDENGPAACAEWALGELVQRFSEDGDHAKVVESLLAGVRLPFSTERQRTMLFDAACTCSDRLDDSARATELFRQLFAEDPADAIAQSAVTRFATLLEAANLDAEIAALWEQQAGCRAAQGEPAAAAALWARAADIAEQKLQDLDRAERDHRQGAALGGEVSLEALARIYTANGKPAQAAAALEWLCAQSARDELAGRALRLAEAYIQAGQPAFARARLEHAASVALEAAPVRQRLAELYRAERAWGPLTELLTTDATRAPDAKTRLKLLQEAARIHIEKRKAPEAAAPLLEQAIELDPDDPKLRLLHADALTRAGRFDEAMAALKRQIESYGSRKPKQRALVHFHLARVSLASGRRAEAIAELDAANKIDPAHPGILQALAKLAFEEGQLDRAEKQYRALLLVIGRDDDGEGPSRAEALLDLSEIAARSEDPVRAAELVDSAFEAALENEREAEALEQALRSRQRYDLLARSVESRLSRAGSASDAARALADLAFLHAEHLGGMAADSQERIRERATSIHQDLRSENAADDRAWAALGRVYDWLGDASAEAEVLERRVSSMQSSTDEELDVDPFYRLAEIRLSDAASRAGGVDVLERALELSPDLPRARQLLEQAVLLAPEQPEVVALYERVARALADDQALAKALSLVVCLPGAHVEALREGVALAGRLEDQSLARTLLESALEDGGEGMPANDAAWAMTALADLREAAGDVSIALDLRERAAGLLLPDEARPLLLSVAGRAASEARDLERAARIYEDLRQQDPADRSVWEPLCDVYRQLGNGERLVALIEETVPLVEQLTDRARLRLEQATILLDEDRTDDAVVILQEILQEDPGQRGAAERLLGILADAGRKDELIELLVSQIDTAKDRQDNAAIVEHSLRLGRLLEEADRSDDAYDVYVAVLDWDKRSQEVLESVIRLAELREDLYVVADAIEALLKVVRGEAAVELASRLVMLRSDQGDEEGAQRALELGFIASPTTVELRDPLLERYAASSEWAGAARVLREAVQVAPDDEDLLARMVEAHQNAGELELALEALGALPEEAPAPPAVERAKATLLGGLGRDEEALAALERAYALDPTCAPELTAALDVAMQRAEPERQRELCIRLVDVLEQSGDGEGARAKLTELVKLAPKDKGAVQRLAKLEEDAGRFDAASTAYRKLIALEEGPALVEAALKLAAACEQAGRFGDARAGLERAVKAVPGDSRARERLRAVYESVGDNRALASLDLEDAASEQQVGQRHALLLRAGALLLMPEGDPAQAVQVLEEAAGLSPESVDGVVLLARSYAAVGRSEEAMAMLNETVAASRGRRSRELSGVYREISRIQLEEGFLSEALTTLTKAFEMDMRNARLAMELGQLALDLDEMEAANRAFRAVTMLRPGEEDAGDGVTVELRAHAQYQLALLAHRAGDPRRAKVLATKALSENPQHELAQQLLTELEGH